MESSPWGQKLDQPDVTCKNCSCRGVDRIGDPYHIRRLERLRFACLQTGFWALASGVLGGSQSRDLAQLIVTVPAVELGKERLKVGCHFALSLELGADVERAATVTRQQHRLYQDLGRVGRLSGCGESESRWLLSSSVGHRAPRRPPVGWSARPRLRPARGLVRARVIPPPRPLAGWSARLGEGEGEG